MFFKNNGPKKRQDRFGLLVVKSIPKSSPAKQGGTRRGKQPLVAPFYIGRITTNFI